MEVEKLDINAGPVDQIGSSSVLAKRPIVGEPSATRKLTMSLSASHEACCKLQGATSQVTYANGATADCIGLILTLPKLHLAT